MPVSDMAKFGSLYLNEGRWNGVQVISEAWVEASLRRHFELDERSAYGYQFWLDLEPLAGETAVIPVARGNGGQRIYIVRELGLLAVITAGNYNSADSRLSEQAFWRYILPAAAAED